MSAIGNFIWFIFGGIVMGLGWLLAGVIMYVSVVFIPWGRSCFVIAKFTFVPFGREAISRKELTGEDDVGTGVSLGILGNIVWFIVCGWWLAIGHAVSGLVTCCTIIGIPFGIQHFKLAGVYSIGQCNILPTNLIIGDVAHGSNGTTRIVRVTEVGGMASMEERPVA